MYRSFISKIVCYIFVESGGDLTTLKKYDDWKSSTVARRYDRNS
ncbi:unnamed protein product [Acanthoscelides obtectus]|uniref:Uncharacterized protein n=1 Tax=Acanthoscelides obtectus TaxID=200917 RepID=A0A9P0MBC3_ACAOB|nr:unnamed protein product [Acanthoscelides obtectus]CAK1675085.1 hypothetical protein AOBTE_LOCUS29890 [Acanthoscelides obtectus]